MTKLKIKEDVGSGKSVDENYPFDEIENGDMFYNYNMDWLVLIVYTDCEYRLIELTGGTQVEEHPGEDFDNLFSRLTEEYGEWYPVRKAKLTFKVGD